MDNLGEWVAGPVMTAIVLDFLSPNSFLRNTVVFICSTPKSSLRILKLLLAGYVDSLHLTEDYNQSYAKICVFLGVLVARRIFFALFRIIRLLITFAWGHAAILSILSLVLGTLSVVWRKRANDAWFWVTLWAIQGPCILIYLACDSTDDVLQSLAHARGALAEFLIPSSADFLYSSAPAFDPSTQIRLLKLHRRFPFFGVYGELISCTINDAPPYHAISYVWTYGPQDDRSLTLHGGKMSVKGNVHDILQRCSSFFGPVLVWIDSICINQADIDAGDADVSEKTLQVRQMQKIYSNAAHVLICLGNGPSFLALGLIRELETVRNFAGDAYVVNHVAGFFKRRKSDIYLRARIKALQELLQHPWFRRVWIVQEAVVPSSIKIFYGQKSINWMEFYGWMGIFNGPLFTLFSSIGTETNSVKGLMEAGSSYVGTLSMPLIVAYRVEYHMLGAQKISHLLRVFGEREAKVPIDKVFALIGMAKHYPNTNLGLLIDYNRSTEESLLLLADFLLSKNETLEVLDCAGIGRREYNPRLPSWVVDWTMVRAGLPLNSKFAPPNVQYYAASEKPSSVVRGNSRQEIVAKGQFIDRICRVVPIIDMGALSGQESEFSISVFSSYMDGALEAAKEHTQDPYPHLGNQALEEALWRTLIGDKTRSQRPAPASYARGWKVQMQLLVEIQQYHSVLNPEAMYSDEATHERMRTEFGPAKIEEIQKANQEFQEYELLFDTAKGQSQHVFCVTERGYIGMVPPYTKEGDSVVLIFGSGVPYVLREADQSGERWNIVGDAYVHGIMDGEGLRLGFWEMDFRIV